MAPPQGMRQASYRGVVFQVENIEDQYGRRLATHTYPGYDEPYTEDLGKEPGVWNIEAFVIGDDYIDQAEALIDACHQPGSGYLVHSWLGGKQVICKDCRPRWSFKGRGECRFQLSFQEEGEPRYPNATDDYAAVTKARAASSLESFVQQFEEVYSLEGPDWLPEEMAKVYVQAMEMISSVAKVAGIGGQALSALIGKVNDAIETAEDIISDAEEVADTVTEVIETVPEVIEDPAAAASALVSLADLSGLEIPEPVTKATQDLNDAAESFSSLVSRLAVTHGIGAAMDADYTSRPEALAARDELVDAVDTLAESASQAGEHSVFEALRQLRADVVAAFKDKAGTLPGVSQLQIKANVTPALVLAYDLYGDLDREAEIVGRNPGLSHPGFASGGTALEVLDA